MLIINSREKTGDVMFALFTDSFYLFLGQSCTVLKAKTWQTRPENKGDTLLTKILLNHNLVKMIRTV